MTQQKRRSFSNRLSFLAVCILAATAPALALDPGGQTLPIEQVRARMWKKMREASYQFDGVLRTKAGARYPFTVEAKGKEAIYRFKNEPLQIRVVIDEERSVVETRRREGDSWTPVTGRAKAQPILGTDITYGDLAMDAVRWPNVRPVGTDTFKTFACWVYDVEAPAGSPFSKARFWVSKNPFGLIKVDGYNEAGEATKHFEVNSVKDVGKTHVPTEILISTYKPGTSISKSQTWVDLDVK